MPEASTSSSSNSNNLTHLASTSAGSPLYSLPGRRRWKRTLARLIDPADNAGSTPIAVDIEFHSCCCDESDSPFSGFSDDGDDEEAAAAARTTTASSRGADRKDPDLDLVYELHYVLDGRGRLSSRPLDGRGKGPRVAAGDSVASFAGSAALRPAGGGRFKKSKTNKASSSSSPQPWWDLATLTVTMPRDASAEAAEAAVRAARGKLRGARKLEGATLSARDAAAVVSGARSRSLRGGSSSAGGGGGGVASGDSGSSCCGKKINKKKQGKSSKKPTQQPLSSSSSSAKNDDDNTATKASKRPTVATTLLRRRPLSRRLSALPAFRLEGQSNRLAVAFDPFSHGNVGFTAGVEVFLPGHVTPRHSHAKGVHELFFVLSGSGVGVAQEVRRESDEEEEEGEGGDENRKFRSLALEPGVAALFLPMQLHAIDVPAAASSPLVCLEVMAPDDRFAERVMVEGQSTGRLTDEELCALAAVGCGGGGGGGGGS